MANSGWNEENFARVDFYTDEFDRAVHQKGARVIWEKSMLCSCIDPQSGQADFTCPSCKGKAFIYFDPKEIRALVYGVDNRNDNQPVGLLDVGTSLLTTRSSDLVSFRDRLTFVDYRTAYSQVLTYSDEDEVEGVLLKYQADAIISVKNLSYEIPSDKYKISPDDSQRIIFEPGTLMNGDRFSILIRTRPVYIVIDMPHELRGTFVKFGKPTEEWNILPRQLMIKREDLMPLKRGELM